MTIYKLRDKQTHEDFLEFNSDIVFQIPCKTCTNIKGCLDQRHKLQDWSPTLDPMPESSPARGGGSGGSSGARSKGKVGGKAAPNAAGQTKNAKPAQKRKSPGATTPPPPAKTSKAEPRSADAKQSGNAALKKDKPGAKRPGKERQSAPAGGSVGVKAAAGSNAKLEKGIKGPALKAKARERDPSETTDDHLMKRPNEQDAASDSSSGASPSSLSPPWMDELKGEEQENADEPGVGDKDGAVNHAREPEVEDTRPKTVSEQLDAVKAAQEALVLEFQSTNDRLVKEEEAKRTEILEYNKTAEAALKEMQKTREEKLKLIMIRSEKMREERKRLVQDRLQEIDAEEARAKIEAEQNELRLQAEKEALSKACESGANTTADATWGTDWDSLAPSSTTAENADDGPVTMGGVPTSGSLKMQKAEANTPALSGNHDEPRPGAAADFEVVRNSIPSVPPVKSQGNAAPLLNISGAGNNANAESAADNRGQAESVLASSGTTSPNVVPFVPDAGRPNDGHVQSPPGKNDKATSNGIESTVPGSPPHRSGPGVAAR